MERCPRGGAGGRGGKPCNARAMLAIVCQIIHPTLIEDWVEQPDLISKLVGQPAWRNELVHCEREQPVK